MLPTWEEIARSISEQIRRLLWMEFWTNRVSAWLYRGYREQRKGPPFPMDN